MPQFHLNDYRLTTQLKFISDVQQDSAYELLELLATFCNRYQCVDAAIAIFKLAMARYGDSEDFNVHNFAAFINARSSDEKLLTELLRTTIIGLCVTAEADGGKVKIVEEFLNFLLEFREKLPQRSFFMRIAQRLEDFIHFVWEFFQLLLMATINRCKSKGNIN